MGIFLTIFIVFIAVALFRAPHSSSSQHRSNSISHSNYHMFSDGHDYNDSDYSSSDHGGCDSSGGCDSGGCDSGGCGGGD